MCQNVNSVEIKELRKKQFFSINFFSISFFVIAGTIIYQLEPSRLTVLLLLIVFMGASCVFTWGEMEGKEWQRFSWSRKLMAYEKKKLGREWYKSKRSELISKLFVILLFVLQLFIGNAKESFMPAVMGVQYWVSFLLALILLTNVGLYFRNRKIDRLSTEELQGFTKNEYRKATILSIVIAMIMIGVTIHFVIG
jgi:hypothetical protein